MRNYFRKHELECHGLDCCEHSAPVNPLLQLALNKFREIIGKPVFLSSAFRCIRHNREVKSEDTSQHVLGNAADIKKMGTIDHMVKIAKMIPEIRCILLYEWGIHIDITPRQENVFIRDKR